MPTCFHKQKIFFICFTLLLILQGIALWFTYYQNQKNDQKFINDSLSGSLNLTQRGILTRLDLLKHELDRSSAVTEIYSYHITQQNFSNMVALESYTFKDVINTYMWIPIVTLQQRTDYETFLQQNITEIEKPPMNLTRAKDRDYYAPLSGITPLPKGAEILFGFDFFSINTTQAFFDTINGTLYWMSNRLNVTGTNSAIALVRTSCSFGDVGYCPKDAILGYHLAIVDMGGLITNTFLRVGVYNVTVQVKNDLDEFIYADPQFDINAAHNFPLNFTVFNRKWYILAHFDEDYISSLNKNTALLSLIGLLIGFLMLNCIILAIFWKIKVTKEREDSAQLRYRIANQMLGYVNHEIRNPLNAIIGLIDLSIEELDNLFRKYQMCDKDGQIIDSIISNLNTANKSSLLLRHIVNDILDVRKLEENKLDLEFTEFDLTDLMSDVDKIIAPKLREKPSLQYRKSYDPKLLIYADRTRVIQLLLNILTNAIKYTHNGYIELTITEVEENIKFSVKDTGLGINEEAKKKIFRPFEQFQENSSRYGGVGLGLYLCKLLIDNMNGTIGFESEVNVGSTFWFCIRKKIDNNDIRHV